MKPHINVGVIGSGNLSLARALEARLFPVIMVDPKQDTRFLVETMYGVPPHPALSRYDLERMAKAQAKRERKAKAKAALKTNCGGVKE